MRTWMMSSVLAIVAAQGASAAMAQDSTVAGPQAAAPTPLAESADQPGDIVVTAQKRTERLQDVPLAVTVVSGERLAAAGGINLEGAQNLVPTLTIRKSGTSLNQSLFLRGVGTSTFSIAGEPSISTVVDGVVYARAAEAFSDLVDLDRIEVLRGPQGTLFGKNASAGVINIVTKRPGPDFGGSMDAGYYFGNGPEYRVRGAVDVPLSQNVRSRFTGFFSDYDGNIRNQTTDSRVNGYHRYGVRGMVVADASPDVQFTLIGDYRRARDNCCAEVIGTAPTGIAATLVPTPRGDETRAVRQNLITRTNETAWGVSLQADATVGTQTVTSITAYRDYKNQEIRDGDFLDQAYVGLNQLHDDGPQTGNTFSQELRLTSPQNQFFEYVAGFFYSRAESERTFVRTDQVCNRTPAPTTPIPCSAAGAPASTFPQGTAVFGSVFKNFALFTQGTFNLNDDLRLIGGLRYTADQLDVFHRRTTLLSGPGINPSFGPFSGKATSTNFSGKAGVQYDIVPESTAYATYARGYKGPAFNIFYNLTATGTNVIAPETADSYEAGLKNSFLNGRVILNLAAYYAKYHNFQANNPDVVAGVVVTRFTNAGTVSTRGGELDLIVRPMRDLNLTGGLAYTDAKVDAFRAPVGGSTSGVIPSGTELPYAPKWKGSLGADYRIRTGGAVDFQLGVQGSYQSSQLSQFDASAAIRKAATIGGYGIVDLSAAVVEAADRYRIGFQVKNLFDQSFAAAIQSGGPGGSYRYIIPRDADRYFGVVGSAKF
ncbi:MAG TPA: TonB-dependent receptor [Sphingomonas sp.]|uniref:TonB-dependent receptor n=1 Tax=Sphingomonas sp. TaxID=28214 RepID=UPI002ED79B3D